MNLIQSVSIRCFRSIRDGQLENVDAFCVLSGLNNSGKSNFLRALNAFFNGVVERGNPIEIDRDYFRPEVRAKKKKVIRITVHFKLPKEFKFRSKLENVESLLTREFRITKEWKRGEPEPLIYLNDSEDPVGAEEKQKVHAFLGLISFRYIPNRVIPTEIILHEQLALRDVLVRRLARFKNAAGKIFKGIEETSEALVSELSKSIRKIGPDIEQIRLATAKSLADLAFRFGYRLRENGVEIEEGEQGSGMQSLLMFQTLHLIDQDYFQQFGWKQAAIWAVEEPESSLNTAMEVQVADFLSRISGSERLQVIATTHSDLMIQHAKGGYYVDKILIPQTKIKQSVATKKPFTDLLDMSCKFGVTRWVNPILYYPSNALVLVEGKTDRDFLTRALFCKGIFLSYKIVCLEDLTTRPDKGGVDTLKSYIKANADAIKSRLPSAPVIVVLDWDAAKKASEFEKTLGKANSFHVVAWDETKANPSLDRSFRGIERFFSDRLIEQAEKMNGNLIARKANGIRSIQGDDVSTLKGILAEIVTKDLQSGDLVFADSFITELHRMASLVPPA